MDDQAIPELAYLILANCWYRCVDVFPHASLFNLTDPFPFSSFSMSSNLTQVQPSRILTEKDEMSYLSSKLVSVNVFRNQYEKSFQGFVNLNH